MKKNYQMPSTKAVMMQQEDIICSSNGSKITGVEGNSGLGYNGGSSEDARGRSFDAWGDGDEE